MLGTDLMKTATSFSLMPLVVVLCQPNLALAVETTLVTSSVTARLGSVNKVPTEQQFQESDTDDAPDGGDKTASVSLINSYGLANINLTATATAKTGDVGVAFSGAGTGVPPILATVTLDSAFARARWFDSGTVTTDLPVTDFALETLLSTGDPFALSTHAKGFQHSTDNVNGSMTGTYSIRSLSPFYQMPPSPLRALGFTSEDWAAYQSSGGTTIVDIPAPDFIPVRIPVVPGLSFDIGFEVTLRASGNSGFGTTEWAGDFSGSLHWAGVQRITDSNGNELPMDHFTFTSQSGFDYMKPFGVPEASSLTLVAISLVAATVTNRRRN
jgi:hypothetical protein